jgi:hypothetical protein
LTFLVVDYELLPPAVVTAFGRLRVERLQLLNAELPGLHSADERPDMDGQLLHVPALRGHVHAEHVEVLVEELVHGGLGPRVPLLVHLCEQPGPGPLCLLGRAGARLDDLGQVIPLPGDRVDTGIDLHAE